MSEGMMWFVAAGVMVILELFTGTFYLLMIGAGLAAGGALAYAGAGIALQILTAAVIGVSATYILWRTKISKGSAIAAEADPNVNLDIGQTLQIEEWKNQTPPLARVNYRGALWDAELAPGGHALAGTFRVLEIHGSRLIVTNV